MPLRVGRPDVRRGQPALQREQDAILPCRGLQRADGAVEGQGDLCDPAVLAQSPQPTHTTVHDLQIQPVPGPGDRLDDQRPLRYDFHGVAQIGRQGRHLDDAPARRPLVGEQIDRVAVDVCGRDLVLEGGDRGPVRPVRERVGKWSDEQARLGPDVGKRKERVARS